MSQRKIEIVLSAVSTGVNAALARVTRGLTTLQGAGVQADRALKALNTGASDLRSTLVGLGASLGAAGIFGKAAGAATNFNSTVEQSRIGIAALVRTFQNVDMGTSFQVAADIQQRLQLAGLETTATYQELLVALQEGIGPALRENFDPKQIVEFTQSMTQAAAALSLPMDQLGQELRAILDGTIDRNARIAKALQITNEDVAGWKAAGTLFEQLQDRLGAFAAAGEQAALTFSGAWSNVQDAVGMALGKASEQAFSRTTALLLRFKDAIVTVDKDTGKFTFNQKIMDALAGIDAALARTMDSFTTEQIADALANLVKAVGNVAEVLLGLIATAVRVGTALGPMAPLVAKVTAAFILWGGAFKLLVSLPLMLAANLLKLVAGLGTVTTGMRTVQAASIATTASLTGLSTGLAGLVAAASAFFAAYKLGEWLTMRKSVEEIAAAQGELERATARTTDRFREISQQTGVTVSSMEELDQAVADGRIHFDQLTSTWKFGSAEQAAASRQTASTMRQATGEALEAMQKKYRDYANEVRRLQGEILGREQSLAAELRDLARSGMSDTSAWQDRKAEAEEYMEASRRAGEEAKAALAAGDTITATEKYKEAISYADEAKSAYKALNTEVKSGEQVVISAQQGLQTAMEGVRQAGEQGIELLRQQEQAAKQSMDNLVGESGFAALTGAMDEAEKAWHKNWQNMERGAADQIEAVSRRLDGLVEDRHVTIWVTEKVKKATGGLIRRMATGGHLPGYGGGDRISALLEAGEFVVRKEAVSKFGAGLFHALNSLRLPEIPRFAAGGMVGGSGSPININLSLAGATYPMQTSPMTAEQLQRDLARAHRLRSR